MALLFYPFPGGENFVALDLIVQHVHSQLEKVNVLSLLALRHVHVVFL